MQVLIHKSLFSLKRQRLIFLNFLYNTLPPFFTFLISLSVTRLGSFALWGEYAKAILLVTFIGQILSWGNKDYLILEFSKKPSFITTVWRQSIISRSIFLIPAFIVIPFFHYGLLQNLVLSFMLFSRFVYQSYDALFMYQRNYLLKITTELLGGLLIAGWVLVRPAPGLSELLLITAIADSLKCLAVIIFSGKPFSFRTCQFRWNYLKKSYLFFLLTFTGLVISKTDLLAATLFLDSAVLGKYQIIMNLLLIIQASSNFIFQPFIKNIYRLNIASIKKISRTLLGWGAIINLFSIAALFYILTFFYKMDIQPFFLLVCYLFTVPIFYYTSFIFYLLRLGRTDLVICINILGALITFMLSCIGMNILGKDVSVLVIASVISQLFLVVSYSWFINHTQRQSYEQSITL